MILLNRKDTNITFIYSDYPPFGMRLFERSSNSSEYRYGFNGQEKDDEISGEGNSYTAEYWQYDPRVARRWNQDPVIKEWITPYATFGNNPMFFIDPNGDDWYKHKLTGNVLWIDSKGQDIEGYTYMGEHRYWDNNFNPPDVPHHWEYFNFLGRGDKANKILGNTVMIAGGVVAIGLSGGTAAPFLTAFAITSGAFSIASGTAQIVLNLSDAPEIAEKIPGGYLDAIVGVTIEYSVDDQNYSEYVEVTRSALNITENLLTLDLRNTPKNLLEGASVTISAVDIINSGVEIKESAETIKAKKKNEVIKAKF